MAGFSAGRGVLVALAAVVVVEAAAGVAGIAVHADARSEPLGTTVRTATTTSAPAAESTTAVAAATLPPTPAPPPVGRTNIDGFTIDFPAKSERNVLDDTPGHVLVGYSATKDQVVYTVLVLEIDRDVSGQEEVAANDETLDVVAHSVKGTREQTALMTISPAVLPGTRTTITGVGATVTRAVAFADHRHLYGVSVTAKADPLDQWGAFIRTIQRV